jgi:CBS domain-containing protein
MTYVSQLLDSKGRHVWTIAPDDSVFEAIKRMADRRIGSLLVVESGQPVGIVTERDYARKVILEGRSSRETPVRDIMTRDVLFARPDQSIEECMALMTEKRIRHLPVIDGDDVHGMLSIGDLVKAKIAHQQFIITHLENYIRG